MKELHVQITPEWSLIPASQEDIEILKHFKKNQILKIKASGVKRPRSVKQNGWVHSIFRTVCDNTEDPRFSTPEAVKRFVKIKLNFYDMDKTVVNNGVVYVTYRSFAFHLMEQDEADRIYSDVKLICADILQCDPKDLDPREN